MVGFLQAEYKGKTLFRTFFQFVIKSPLLLLIVIVAWLFFHFSNNTYQNAVFAIEEREQLLQEKHELMINKEQLILLRSYFNSDAFIYEEALKLGYSFDNEIVIDVDYSKIDIDESNQNNWWRDIFKN